MDVGPLHSPIYVKGDRSFYWIGLATGVFFTFSGVVGLLYKDAMGLGFFDNLWSGLFIVVGIGLVLLNSFKLLYKPLYRYKITTETFQDVWRFTKKIHWEDVVCRTQKFKGKTYISLDFAGCARGASEQDDADNRQWAPITLSEDQFDTKENWSRFVSLISKNNGATSSSRI
ncbi:hypothetical protein BC777_3352 [Yoonia maricola]|uniref:Uncharacterized protein n=1 Tax=Yoonia maricola TaxID=420999 RepID=A0A2M8W340_9RHOB|nr:hypothetical protein BC777_3352 [Yoonia maricola]